MSHPKNQHVLKGEDNTSSPISHPMSHPKNQHVLTGEDNISNPMRHSMSHPNRSQTPTPQMSGLPTLSTVTIYDLDGQLITVSAPVISCPKSIGQGRLTAAEKTAIRRSYAAIRRGPVIRSPKWECIAQRILGLDRQSLSHRGEIWLGEDT
jgi:hypothetical protein